MSRKGSAGHDSAAYPTFPGRVWCLSCVKLSSQDRKVHTDGWAGYDGLSKQGYSREITVLSSPGDPAHVSMPAVHRVASLLKKWLPGTRQDGVDDSQVDFYLEEFIFRFNRRTSRSRGLLFYRLIEQAVANSPVP